MYSMRILCRKIVKIEIYFYWQRISIVRADLNPEENTFFQEKNQ